MIKRLLTPLVFVLLAASCSTGSGASSSGKVLNVVAGENFWGSIAAQLAGDRVRVQSVVTDPNADPHEYESNTNDARAFAVADLVVLNGAGYDDWAQKLLSASPNADRKVLVVADLLGKKKGDNPHFWYNPAWVVRVADKITEELKSIDAGDSSYFDEQRSAFGAALQAYEARLAEIKQKFSGMKVGATESIFVYMAQALGLDLISPPEFMNAVAEGNDPPVASVIAFQSQVTQKQVKALVYNVQTATAVTTNIRHLAAAQDIPVVGVSETLEPLTVTFQDWQLSQLIALENALNSDALAT